MGNKPNLKDYSTSQKNDKESSRAALAAWARSNVTNCCKLATSIQNRWIYLCLTVILSHRQKLNKFHLFSALKHITSCRFTKYGSFYNET
jgi:hypothetical protein